MSEAILMNRSATPSSFKVGDIRYSTRSSIGNNYVLCNGDKVTGIDYESNPTNKLFYSKKSPMSYSGYATVGGESYIVLRDYVHNRNILVWLYNCTDSTGNIQSNTFINIRAYDTNDDEITSLTKQLVVSYDQYGDGCILDGCWCSGGTNGVIYLVVESGSSSKLLSINLDSWSYSIFSSATSILSNVDKYSNIESDLAVFRWKSPTKSGSMISSIGSNVGLIDYTLKGSLNNYKFKIFNSSGTSINTIASTDLFGSTGTESFIKAYIHSYACSSNVTGLVVNTQYSESSSSTEVKERYCLLFINNSTGAVINKYNCNSYNTTVTCIDKANNKFCSCTHSLNKAHISVITVNTTNSQVTCTSTPGTSATAIDFSSIASITAATSKFVFAIKGNYYLYIAPTGQTNPKVPLIARINGSLGSSSMSIDTQEVSTVITIDPGNNSDSAYPWSYFYYTNYARNTFSNDYGSNKSFLPIYFSEKRKDLANQKYVYLFGPLYAPIISKDGYNAFMKVK